MVSMKHLSFVALLAPAIASCGVPANKAQKDSQSPLEQIEVTAVQVASEFKKNEAAAFLKYRGKQINVSGSIESIDLDFQDNPVIHLKSAEIFQSVAIYGISTETAAKFEKGQKIVFGCTELTEVIGSPQVNNCVGFDKDGNTYN